MRRVISADEIRPSSRRSDTTVGRSRRDEWQHAPLGCVPFVRLFRYPTSENVKSGAQSCRIRQNANFALCRILHCPGFGRRRSARQAAFGRQPTRLDGDASAAPDARHRPPRRGARIAERRGAAGTQGPRPPLGVTASPPQAPLGGDRGGDLVGAADDLHGVELAGGAAGVALDAQRPGRSRAPASSRRCAASTGHFLAHSVQPVQVSGSIA